MLTVLPVEQPYWFSLRMPADPRMAPVVRDLAAKIARQVGCAGDEADALGAALVEAVSHAIERGGDGRGGTHVEILFRIDLSAFEVTLLLRGDDDRAVAALAEAEPETIWPVDVLRRITGRFEISRDPQGSRCRVTRPVGARQGE